MRAYRARKKREASESKGLLQQAWEDTFNTTERNEMFSTDITENLLEHNIFYLFIFFIFATHNTINEKTWIK